MPPKRDTPAMKQYAAMKAKAPGCVLFFRMGDFYEMFDDDAVLAHRVLGITLTERTEGVPMAGVPYHSMGSYLRRMVEAGHKVAIADQIQDPREAKGVVERAITRIVTPGTRIDEDLLTDDAANNLAAVCFLGEGEDPAATVAYSVVEVSTGQFILGEAPAHALADELARASPSELLYCETGDGNVPPRVRAVIDATGAAPTARPSWHFRHAESVEALQEQFGVQTLEGFGLREDDPALRPAGVLVRYLRETQGVGEGSYAASSEYVSSGTPAAAVLRARSLAHLRPPMRHAPSDHVVIDGSTLRSLEVERTTRGGETEGSLVGVFAQGDASPRTAMGKRLLREWLCRPLAGIDAIRARQARVSTLVEDRRAARELRDALGGVQDVARICGRVGLGRAMPRDVVALGRSLAGLDAIAEPLRNAPAFDEPRGVLEELRAQLTPVAEEIARTCVDDPPPHLREGGLIRDGVDSELDECRALQRESDSWLANYQAELIERHELPSLKVGYNKVFGYYIELPAAQARRAPDTFTRKQTLKNAERYITPELKDYEDRVLRAGERGVVREHELFADLCARVTEVAAGVSRFGETVGELDVLACFAAKAVQRSWVMPDVVEDSRLRIDEGRHPVLDEVLVGDFVPNDCALGEAETEDDAERARLALITGPNMSGKSTYIRQCALIALLAHTGSFVPAQHAQVGLMDRIFTRLGADDALHRGQSTFMVEMIETANILHHATDRSLVILDEIGRGTSTLDGLSLAWAIAEHLAPEAPDESGNGRQRAEPLVLFATHYHELTELAERTGGRVRNLHVAVEERGEEITFLHTIQPGAASGSYGIHVARLAGLPRGVVSRAQKLLDSLSVSQEETLGRMNESAQRADARAGEDQMTLFTQYIPHPVVEELKGLDITRMSPMDAFEELRRLVHDLDDGA